MLFTAMTAADMMIIPPAISFQVNIFPINTIEKAIPYTGSMQAMMLAIAESTFFIEKTKRACATAVQKTPRNIISRISGRDSDSEKFPPL